MPEPYGHLPSIRKPPSVGIALPKVIPTPTIEGCAFSGNTMSIPLSGRKAPAEPTLVAPTIVHQAAEVSIAASAPRTSV